MTTFSAEQARNFISNQQRPKKDLPTPFWSVKNSEDNEIGLDGHVQIRKMSGAEGFASSQLSEVKDKTAFTIKTCLILKDTGEPLFTSTQDSMILDLNEDDLLYLFRECLSFSGKLAQDPASTVKAESKKN